MAKAKTGSKKPKERVPTDDPQVLALVERVEALGVATMDARYRSWLSAPERQQAPTFALVAVTCAQAVRGPELVPPLIETIALVDEPRVLAVLGLLVRMIAGDHRRWLNGATFDNAAIVADSVCRANQSAAVASFDTLSALARDPSSDIRAQLAFVLPWLGPLARDRSIELLRALAGDRASSVRRNAIVALGLLGDRARIDALFADEDEGVRVAAAIAATFVPEAAMDERVLSTLETLLVRPLGPFATFTFANGDLSGWAIQRYGRLSTQFDERAAERFDALLSGPTGPLFSGAAIRAVFSQYVRGTTLTRTQRVIASKYLSVPTLRTPESLIAMREVGLTSGPQYVPVALLIDEFRDRVGLPRPPPESGPLELVTLPDSELAPRYAQHWLADFAVAPMPAQAEAIAEAIAHTISTEALVELLVRGARDWDGTDLPRERTDAIAFDVPLPEGLELRDGKYVGPADGWPDRFRVWLAAREAEGWLLSGLWWYGVQVQATLFDRIGRQFVLDYGHEWNSGNPDLASIRATPRATHRLTPLVARAARARDAEAFDRAMASRLDAWTSKGTIEQWLAYRVSQLAIEIFAQTGEAPPALYDRAVQWAQKNWTYVIAAFGAYARLLPPERREALALACARESTMRLPLLAAFANTPAVIELLTEQFANDPSDWSSYLPKMREQWAWVLDEEVIEKFAAAVVRRRAPKRR